MSIHRTIEIDIECSKCDAETAHVEEGDERICITCGQINQYLDADSLGYYWRDSTSNAPLIQSRQ